MFGNVSAISATTFPAVAAPILFTAAALTILTVFVGTLLPAVPRIVALLRGDWS